MATDASTAPVDIPQAIDPSPIPWDGDRMFNIYIYDYCLKRGFRKTAHELQQEAAIPAQSQPPINAKQGLLFEWWSVFWVLFTAKSSGNGPEEALVYTQHQAQMQAAQQQKQGRPPQPPPGGVRYQNGVRPPNQPGPQLNGVVPPPSQQQGAPLPNGTQNQAPFPGNMQPQPNGVPGSSTGSLGGPPPQAPNMGQPMVGQRPSIPQRGLNGGPFQSPTMAHSPPNQPTGQPPNHAGGMGPVGANQPLTQMAHRSMLPPSGSQGMMNNPQQQTPQPAFQSLGRSPSNPGSPAQNMMQPSPSMAHRQPPNMIPMTMDTLNAELHRIPPNILMKLKQDINIGDKDPATMSVDEKHQIVTQFRRSSSMKQPGTSGPSNLPPGQPGPSPVQALSGLRNTQLPPNAQQQGQQPLQPQQGQQNLQQRGAKRNSTSPGQEPEQLPRNDSSPPDRKRPRTSPAGGEHPQPPMTPMYIAQPGQSSMQPPGIPPNGMVRGMPMTPYGAPPMTGMTNPMLGHGLGTPQMSPVNPAMNPGMMGQPGQSGINELNHYRQQMQHIHKQPQHPQQGLGNVPSPSTSDMQGGRNMHGGGPPGNRMGQNKPMSGMLPPPSPAMNAKTPSGAPIKAEDGSAPNGRVDASPQNSAAGVSAGGAQGLGQPHPGAPPTGPPGSGPGPGPTSTPAPPTPSGSGPGGMTAPSPSAILNATSTPSMSASHPPPPPPPSSQQQQQPSMPGSMSGPMSAGAGGPNGMVEALDMSFTSLDFPGTFTDFDTSVLGDSSSLNFERDFAAWFDPPPENAA